MDTAVGTGLARGADGASAGRRAAEAAVGDLPDDRVDFCQVFPSVAYEYRAVIDGVRAVVGDDATLIGCSANESFSEDGVEQGAVAVGAVAGDSLAFYAGMGEGLSENVQRAVRDAVAPLPETVEGRPYRAAITLHDGLASVGEELALVAQQKLGPEVTIAGGAAADDHRLEATHVFRGDEVAEDAVVVGLVAAEERPVVAAEHGHEPISEPFEVTDSDGDLVFELDGKPAFEVWKAAVREPVREEFDVAVDDLDREGRLLGRIMCEFEFAIDQGEGYKTRWPWVERGTGDALHFAVDVPEGTVMRVTHGRPDDQVASAGEAVRRARERAGDTPVAGGFVYDCACRGIVLGDRFETAVDRMAAELDVPLVGFETYGEMCMTPGQWSGFYNTSTVVLLLPE